MRERNESSIRHCPSPCNEKVACLPIESEEMKLKKNFLNPLKIQADKGVRRNGLELCYSVYSKEKSVIKIFFPHDREWPFFKYVFISSLSSPLSFYPHDISKWNDNLIVIFLRNYHSKFFMIHGTSDVTLFDKQVFCKCKFGYKEISQYKRTVCFPGITFFSITISLL